MSQTVDTKERSLLGQLLKYKRILWNYPSKALLIPTINKIFPRYTLVGYPSLCQAYDAVAEIEHKHLEGAIVEMGCWNGGCGALMALTAKKFGNSKRKVWLFDSFEGLPEFTEEDAKKAKKIGVAVRSVEDTSLRATGIFKAEEKNVVEVGKLLGVEDQIHVVKGWFQDTVPDVKKNIGKIAILRLDADIYEPTKYSLDQLYDLVVPGGLIIFDDYASWEGCRRAVYEFFVEHGIYPRLQAYRYGPPFFRKPV